MDQPRDDKGRFASKVGIPSILVAGVVGISAAVGVGAEGASLGAGAGPTVGANSPSISASTRLARGKQKSTRTQRNLVTSGLRSSLRAEADSDTCADDARGQVREFLATHPCESVYRSLFEVRRGDVAAVVAVAWIEMVELHDATELKALVDRPGTGNINPLPPPRGHRVVDVAEPAYASRQDGRLVTTVEVEPITVNVSQRALEAIAEEALAEATRPE
ncbi:hypothetical protein [Actinomycetospora flava]|uniref:Uncharacterized protein n=1 Tax=Actinomycetospora flava TaxID=3129232 RepID=A0ABU8M5D4_9PSEU